MPLLLPWLITKLRLVPAGAWRAFGLAVAIVVAVGGFYFWAHGRGFDQGEAKAHAAHAKIEAARVKAQAAAEDERDRRQAQAEEDQAKRNAEFATRDEAAAKKAAALSTRIALLVAKQKVMPECDVPAEDKAVLNESIQTANARIGLANKQLLGAGK